MWRVDPAHANAFGAWQAMGSPAKPTVAQIAALKRASMLVSEDVRLKDGRLNLSLPRQGVALVEF
jgi:xylan 1,4-beta-xylosidase